MRRFEDASLDIVRIDTSIITTSGAENTNCEQMSGTGGNETELLDTSN